MSKEPSERRIYREDYTVLNFVKLFKKSGMTPRAFALWVLVERRELCDHVMDIVGSWPSSEPELAALQAAYS